MYLQSSWKYINSCSNQMKVLPVNTYTHHLSFHQSNVWDHGTRCRDRRNVLVPVDPVLHPLQDVQHHLCVTSLGLGERISEKHKVEHRFQDRGE